MIRTRDRARAVQPWQLRLKADATNPTFAVELDRQRFAANGAAYPFDSVLTLTRSATKWVYNSSGLLTSVGANLPAYDYDPVTGEAKGILVEESRTNLLLRSSEFEVWTKIGFGSGAIPIVTNNFAVAPDGTLSADRIQMNRGVGVSSNDYSLVYQSIAGANTTRVKSIWIKSNTGVNQTLVIYDAQGAIGTTVVATSSWQRFILGPNISAATATLAFGVRGGSSYFSGGDQILDILAWGAQIEDGTFATSYIPTTSAAVTRTADVIVNNSATPVPFASWYNQSEGTVVVKFQGIGGTATYPRVYEIGGATNANRHTIDLAATTRNISLEVFNGGAFQASLGSSISGLSNSAAALAYKTNDFAFSVNGDAPTTDTSGTAPTCDSLALGKEDVAAGSYFCGWIKSMYYYPIRVSDAELQRITTL